MKPANKSTTSPAKTTPAAKVSKDRAPNEVVILRRSVFTNGQYCAAIRVERTAA